MHKLIRLGHLPKPDLPNENPFGRWRFWPHYTVLGYTCTDEVLAGLGKMYGADERCKKNIDKSGEGTAEFAADAIATYTKKI